MALAEYADLCLSLKATAQLVKLPLQVTATALVLLHRYQDRQAQHQAPSLVSDHDVVVASLFLAAKVEEAGLRTNDLLNAAKYCAERRACPTLRRAFPALATVAAPTPAADGEAGPRTAGNAAGDETDSGPPIEGLLAGDAYYAAKDSLIIAEQVLLRSVAFQLACRHPYGALLNFARSLGCPAPLTRTAVCLVHDSLVHTTLCLRWAPADVAAGALHLAALLTGTAHALPHSGARGWWEALGVAAAAVEGVGHVLCDMLSRDGAAAGVVDLPDLGAS